MNKKLLLILVLMLVVLIAGAAVLYQGLSGSTPSSQLGTLPPQTTAPAESTDATADTTQPQVFSAPDFTVYDAQGNAVKLSDFIGMPIVLNFWASWCGPCQSEMPDFQEASQRLQGQVQFLMVNMTDGSRETLDTAKKFLSETGYTFPVYFDTDSEAAIRYGVYALPTTYFINAEGHLVAYAESAISGDILQKGIDMITDTGNAG